MNGDGFIDILAGNWGHNNKFVAGKNGPLKLYVKDFDKNGSTEQVMAYTIDGKEYTFLAKDELERSLPVLKKAYLNYSDVAGKTVSYMFYDLFNNYRELKAEQLGSSCFINDGKGNFVRTSLPAQLQMAPLMSFASMPGNNLQFITGGNFYGVVPYEGRYDAQPISIFRYDAKDKHMQFLQPVTGNDAEVRDLKWYRGPAGEYRLLVAANNGPLRLYRQKN